MSTIRYNDWLSAVSGGTFNVADVDMNVMLVADTYTPDETDIPADVTPFIIKGVSVIVEDYFSTNPMSNILDEIKAKMEIGFKMFGYEIGLEIERVFAGQPERIEKLKQIIQMPSDNNYQFWNDLKENGIKYFVLESLEHDCLTFSEEL